MIRNLAIIIILLFLNIGAESQWYQKKYGVNDISLLSQQQLNESLQVEKTNLLVSEFFMFAGGCGMAVGQVMINNINNDPLVPPDDPSHFMTKLYFFTGVGFAAGGLAYLIVSKSHINNIRKTREILFKTGSEQVYSEFRSTSLLIPEIGFMVGF